jgi:hypothetical protein
MKTFEELQEEYNETVKTFELAKKVFVSKTDEIKEAVVSYAKYKVGDKVSCLMLWNSKKREIGIIRSVCANKEYGEDIISVKYIVGKITQLGVMHKTQNIYYREIDEKKIELVK